MFKFFNSYKFVMGSILVFSVPFLILFYMFIQTGQSKIAFSKKQLDGVEYHDAMMNLAIVAQRYRGTHFLSQNNVKLDETIDTLRNQLFQKIEIIDKKENMCTLFELCDDWKAAKIELMQSFDASQNTSPIARFEIQTKAINQIGYLMRDVGLASNLVLDSDPRMYSLVSLNINTIHSIIEEVAYARGRFAGFIANGATKQTEIMSVMTSYGKISSYKKDFTSGSSNIQTTLDSGNNIFKQQHSELIRSLDYFTSQLADLTNTKNANMNANTFFNIGTNVVDNAMRIYFTTNQTILQDIQKRIDTQEKNLKHTFAYLCLSFLGAASIFYMMWHMQCKGVVANSKLQVNKLLNTVSQGICVMNDSGVIQSVSPSAERVLGCVSASLIGRPFLDIVADKDQNRLAGLFDTTEHGEHARADDFTLNMTGKRHNGELFAMQIELNNYKKDGQNLYIAHINDVSSLLQS